MSADTDTAQATLRERFKASDGWVSNVHRFDERNTDIAFQAKAIFGSVVVIGYGPTPQAAAEACWKAWEDACRSELALVSARADSERINATRLRVSLAAAQAEARALREALERLAWTWPNSKNDPGRCIQCGRNKGSEHTRSCFIGPALSRLPGSDAELREIGAKIAQAAFDLGCESSKPGVINLVSKDELLDSILGPAREGEAT